MKKYREINGSETIEILKIENGLITCKIEDIEQNYSEIEEIREEEFYKEIEGSFQEIS